MTDDQKRCAAAFVKDLSRHLVSLQGTYVALDEGGQPSGEDHFFSYSAFVLSIFDKWLLVTAGHILKELNRSLERGEIALRYCQLADYFGPDPKVDYGVPFDYVGTPQHAVDDDSLGLDVGIIPLSNYYRALLERNSVVSITRGDWEQSPDTDFDLYGLLGLPEELFDRQKRLSVSGNRIIGGVRPTLMFLTKTEAQPRDKPTPTHPWFVGELKDKDEIRSIVGMSGGPIFGFKLRPGKPPLYTVMAVQSWWDKERRLVFGCPLSTFMGMVQREILAVVAERLG